MYRKRGTDSPRLTCLLPSAIKTRFCVLAVLRVLPSARERLARNIRRGQAQKSCSSRVVEACSELRPTMSAAFYFAPWLPELVPKHVVILDKFILGGSLCAVI